MSNSSAAQSYASNITPLQAGPGAVTANGHSITSGAIQSGSGISSSTTWGGAWPSASTIIPSIMTAGTITPNPRLTIGKYELNEEVLGKLLLLLEAIDSMPNDSELKNFMRWAEAQRKLEG
jgi:hypothetical protein